MLYTAIDVAKYVINKCTIEQHAISNLQLQKILYYIQRTYLRNNNMIFDEDFEAWQFGPVIPEVYNKYCSFGGMPIRMQYDVELDLYDKYIVDPIVESKRMMNPWTMVDDTHRPGMAWDEVYQNGLGNHQEISKQLIRAKG